MKDLLYVTAQPDVPYFHWQCEVYGHNFVKNGIPADNIHMIFGSVGDSRLSAGAKKLRDYGYKVHFYRDKRPKKYYIPSVKPYLISEWLKENPKLGRLFFLHDADIIFRELPNLEKYIEDDICYLADTKGYIAYSYIKSVCDRYEKQHKESYNLQLLSEMTNVVGIDIDCVRKNQDSSGGGQYIIKNTNSEQWFKIYENSNELYDQMKNYHKRFPINGGEIQFWTAEMWSLLWNLWCFEKETKIIDELDFCWATDNLEKYNKKYILHMAGVLDSMKETKFFKGDFIDRNPLILLQNDPEYFDFIDENSATNKYIDVMRSIIKKQKEDYL